MTVPDRIAVLLVEDDPSVARFLATSLSAAGYAPCVALTLSAARVTLADRRVALVILDLGLPDGNGRDFLVEFRRSSDVPVLVLSAQQDEAAKVDCLDHGADDYLGKPFGVDELLARVRAALRRSAKMRLRDDRFELDGLVVDLNDGSVSRDGKPIHLTATEHRLLAALARRPGAVCPHRRLLADVWGSEHVDDTHYLRIHMGRLRAKIERLPAEPRFLLTEPGLGYRLADS